MKITTALNGLFLIYALAKCGKNDKEKPAEYADKYIDLHLHLDGAFTVDIAKKLAEIQGLELPTDNDDELHKLLTVPEDCTSLNTFLTCFDYPCSLLQTREGITEAVRLVADNIKSQGVIYAEIRFAPQKSTDLGLTQEDAILAALEGLKKTDLKVNLILCCMRGSGNEAENFETVELAKKYLVEDGGVVAIDLAGAESLYPTSDYEELFAKARGYNIPFTIHAGEAAGPDSIETAINFGAKRIGHSVTAREDEKVMEMIRDQGIFLEICPTSSIQTGAVDDIRNHPFMDYLKDGFKITINTDDPGIEGITLADEFRLLESVFGVTPEQEEAVLANSVDAAFTSEAVRKELRRELGLE